MENRRKPKYDIPLVIVDTRSGQKEIPKKKQGVRQVNATTQEQLPDFGVLLKHLFVSLQKPLIALKYRFSKMLDKFFEDVEVPWLKILALCWRSLSFSKDAISLSYYCTIRIVKRK